MIIVVSNAVVAHMYFYDTKVRQVSVTTKAFKCSKATARGLPQLSSTKIKIEKTNDMLVTIKKKTATRNVTSE